MSKIDRLRRQIMRQASRFSREESGSFAVIAALSAVVVIGLAGAGLDIGRAQLARQKLYQSASLACQYARKTSAVAASDTGKAAVNSFFNSNLESQKIVSNQVSSQFDAIATGPAHMTANFAIPTTFLGIFNIPSLQVSVEQQCYSAPPAIQPGHVVLQENFETPASSGTVTRDCGVGCFQYVIGYNGWTTVGDYGEIEISGGYKIAPPEGLRVGELTPDTNAAISKKVSLAAGTYELRYFFVGGPYIPVPEYYGSTVLGTTTFNNDPTPICSHVAADVSWATSDRSRIAVYVSPDEPNFSANYLSTNNSPANRNWRPADLVDVCIYSRGWVERSATITIATTGDYWLTYAAQGNGALYEGGQLDNIRLCYQACVGSRQLAPFETPGHLLFQEDFRGWGADSPGITSSYASFGFATGVPAANGWQPIGPNSFEIWSRPPFDNDLQGGYQYVMEMEEYGDSTNRSISRQILLAPGTYQISYNYLSRAYFPTLGSNVYCAVNSSTYPANDVPNGSDWVLIAFAGLSSWVNYISYVDSYRTSALRVAFDSELSTNQSNRPSQIIDYCSYSSRWTTRYITVQVTKPRFYWLTFSGDPIGVETFGLSALIGNIRLCAIRCTDGPTNQTPITIAP